MRRRIDAFGMLLGGVPSIDNNPSEAGQSFADDVLKIAGKKTCPEQREVMCRSNSAIGTLYEIEVDDPVRFIVQ